jgi:hypothetical protein
MYIISVFEIADGIARNRDSKEEDPGIQSTPQRFPTTEIVCCPAEDGPGR